MSKTTEFWHSRHIVNSHNLVSLYRYETGGVGVYISWTPQELGRAYRPAGYHVMRPGFKTDPTEHWMHYGNKFFMKGGLNVTDCEADAKAWASEKYGITEWVKIAGFPRDWFPKEIADWAKVYKRAVVGGLLEKEETK